MPGMRSDTEGRELSEDGQPSAWRSRWDQARVWAPALAVIAVAGTAVLTAVMVTQARHEPADPARPVAADSRLGRAGQPQVAQPACRDCGVVESVVMLERQPQAYPVAYQVRIRMDDGTVRMVEQPGALAAGSRVMVAGGSVRAVPGRAAPG